jgi:hypothetical protein
VTVLQEFNPMLGHQGCRLGISYPEITEMQARAIFEAACELQAGKNPYPECDSAGLRAKNSVRSARSSNESRRKR